MLLYGSYMIGIRLKWRFLCFLSILSCFDLVLLFDPCIPLVTSISIVWVINSAFGTLSKFINNGTFLKPSIIYACTIHQDWLIMMTSSQPTTMYVTFSTTTFVDCMRLQCIVFSISQPMELNSVCETCSLPSKNEITSSCSLN